MQERAPKLSDYEVGFQLLDKSDEGDKAVGVFGFKAGPNWFYAPVFYLAGKVKGYELLYIKHENIFVPLRENWVNYLLSKRPTVLGSSIDRNSRLFGVSNPDFTQLSRSPTKYASEKVGFDEELHRSMAKAACRPETIAEGFAPLELGAFLKQASLPVLEKFVAICTEFPKVAAAFDKWHGVETLSAAVQAAKTREKAASASFDRLMPRQRDNGPSGSILGTEKKADTKSNNGNQGGLKIIGPNSTHQSIIPEKKDQAELERRLQQKLVMQDDRNESDMSRLYTSESTSTLTNPTVTGIYDVLLKEGEFSRCLVLIAPRGATSTAPFATVIELDGDKPTYVNVKSTEVWVGDSDGKRTFNDWLKDQPQSDTISGEDFYVAVGPNGDSTVPFRRRYNRKAEALETPTEKPDGENIYQVELGDDWAHRYDRSTKRDFYRGDDQTGSSADAYNEYRDGVRVHLNSTQGTRLRCFRGDIYVPEGYRIVKARNSPISVCDEENDTLKVGDLASAYFHIIGKTANFEPGTPADAQKALTLQTEELTIEKYGSNFFVNGQPFSDKSAAVIHLARDHWMREGTAYGLLDKAASQPGDRLTYRIKYAERISQDAPSAPTIPPDYVSHGNIINPDEQTQYNQEYAIPVPSMRANFANRTLYNPNTHFDPNAGGLGGGYSSDPWSGGQSGQGGEGGDLAAAVNSGQKEVFDTSVIGTLLKAVRDDSLVDRYLGPMVGGVDALGRLLFMFYWHGDEFAERYGKQDMPELEDSLRNAFEQAGDVVLFLRQKSVNPQGDGSASIDLGAASNATNGL